MANRIKCTILSGETILVNFDNAKAIDRGDLKGETQISFIAEAGSLKNQGTPDALLEGELLK